MKRNWIAYPFAIASIWWMASAMFYLAVFSLMSVSENLEIGKVIFARYLMYSLCSGVLSLLIWRAFR